MTKAPGVVAALLLAGSALAGPERDYNEPPPGAAPADAQLWRDLRGGTSWAVWQVGRVAQCSARIRYGKYYELLDAAIQAGPPAEAAKAKELRAGLEAAADRAQRAVPADGGRVHACRVALLDFEQRIDPANVEVVNERDAARAEAKACVARMNGTVSAVTPAADGLEGALDEIDRYLKRAAPAPGAGEPAPVPPPKAWGAP